MQLQYNVAIAFLGIISRNEMKTYSHKNLYRLFTAALFVPKEWNQFSCLSVCERLNCTISKPWNVT